MRTKSSEQTKREIEERFGFFPPFFAPALATPSVLDSLWQRTLSDYIENPLPALFKEKLAASIARFCTVPYCLVCHSSTLRPLGMDAKSVLEFLDSPIPGFEELNRKANSLPLTQLSSWPAEGSDVESVILDCSLAVFLNHDSANCQRRLRDCLSAELYDSLILFIAYNRTALTWAEAHPELNYSADKRAIDNLAPLIAAEPKLEEFFKNYLSRTKAQSERKHFWLSEESQRLIDSERQLCNELEKANENLNSFFMQAPVPLVILRGPHHHFALANPPYERLIGRKAMGKTVSEVFSHEEVGTFIPLLDGVYRTGVPHIGKELPLVIADEYGVTQDLWIDLGYYPFRDAHGGIKGILAIVQDVTDQVRARKHIEATAKELATERNKLEAAFTNSPAALALFRGPTHVIEKTNVKWTELVSARDYLGKTYREAYPELLDTPLPGILDQVFATGKTHVAHEMKVRVEASSGQMEDLHYDFSYVRINDDEGRPYGLFCHALNVTDRVSVRQRMEGDAEQLGQAVAGLKDERELRERFVAALTHDLRTPLTAAKMSAQVLELKASDPNMVRTMAVRIAGNIDRTDHMIQDLLDANRIKAGDGISLTLGRCRYEELIKDALGGLEQIHGPRFRFKIQTPDLAGVCDEDALERVIENLAANAVKYGASGRPITVSLRSERKNSVSIEVHNDGNPISPEDQRTIFNQYRRSGSASSGGQQGWGIGLTLVKGITEAHGGSVHVESVPGNGTRFTIHLPMDGKVPST